MEVLMSKKLHLCVIAAGLLISMTLKIVLLAVPSAALEAVYSVFSTAAIVIFIGLVSISLSIMALGSSVFTMKPTSTYTPPTSTDDLLTSKSVNNEAEKLLDQLVSTFIERWYLPHLSQDSEFVCLIKYKIAYLIKQMVYRLAKTDLVELLKGPLVDIITQHLSLCDKLYTNKISEGEMLGYLAGSNSSGDSRLLHPAVLSKASELAYHRKIWPHFLSNMFDESLDDAVLSCVGIAEILTNAVFIPSFSKLADPKMINRLIDISLEPGSQIPSVSSFPKVAFLGDYGLNGILAFTGKPDPTIEATCRRKMTTHILDDPLRHTIKLNNPTVIKFSPDLKQRCRTTFALFTQVLSSKGLSLPLRFYTLYNKSIKSANNESSSKLINNNNHRKVVSVASADGIKRKDIDYIRLLHDCANDLKSSNDKEFTLPTQLQRPSISNLSMLSSHQEYTGLYTYIQNLLEKEYALFLQTDLYFGHLCYEGVNESFLKIMLEDQLKADVLLSPIISKEDTPDEECAFDKSITMANKSNKKQSPTQSNSDLLSLKSVSASLSGKHLTNRMTVSNSDISVLLNVTKRRTFSFKRIKSTDIIDDNDRSNNLSTKFRSYKSFDSSARVHKKQHQMKNNIADKSDNELTSDELISDELVLDRDMDEENHVLLPHHINPQISTSLPNNSIQEVPHTVIITPLFTCYNNKSKSLCYLLRAQYSPVLIKYYFKDVKDIVLLYYKLEAYISEKKLVLLRHKIESIASMGMQQKVVARYFTRISACTVLTVKKELVHFLQDQSFEYLVSSDENMNFNDKTVTVSLLHRHIIMIPTADYIDLITRPLIQWTKDQVSMITQKNQKTKSLNETRKKNKLFLHVRDANTPYLYDETYFYTLFDDSSKSRLVALDEQAPNKKLGDKFQRKTVNFLTSLPKDGISFATQGTMNTIRRSRKRIKKLTQSKKHINFASADKSLTLGAETDESENEISEYGTKKASSMRLLSRRRSSAAITMFTRDIVDNYSYLWNSGNSESSNQHDSEETNSLYPPISKQIAEILGILFPNSIIVRIINLLLTTASLIFDAIIHYLLQLAVFVGIRTALEDHVLAYMFSFGRQFIINEFDDEQDAETIVMPVADSDSLIIHEFNLKKIKTLQLCTNYLGSMFSNSDITHAVNLIFYTIQSKTLNLNLLYIVLDTLVDSLININNK